MPGNSGAFFHSRRGEQLDEPLSFKELDAALHRARIDSRTHAQRRHDGRFDALPAAAFVFCSATTALDSYGDTLLRFTFAPWYQPPLHANAETPPA